MVARRILANALEIRAWTSIAYGSMLVLLRILHDWLITHNFSCYCSTSFNGVKIAVLLLVLVVLEALSLSSTMVVMCVKVTIA